MSKSLYIAEKPSVAQEFAKALKEDFRKRDGYLESASYLVTWCVGHLVTMSYPEAYDIALKRWTLEPLPFLPKIFKYEVIPAVKKQFHIVSELLKSADVKCIYVCTDSGREGEYIYRLVEQMAKVPKETMRKRVWIDSQTEEEVLRGIREAKPLSEYDNLSASAYLRAKEDYLMGINFSRVLSLKYGNAVRNFLKSEKYNAIAVGRVMTCVLGMVVRREREIRSFVKTPFYRVISTFFAGEQLLEAEFRAVEGSKYFQSPLLYKENGFRERKNAEALIEYLTENEPVSGELIQLERKKENKNPPLFYNLAELQNDCARILKISPDETLKYAQELYEKKLVTYPRTDARVLSTAVSKEITKNIGGLKAISKFQIFAEEILKEGSYQNISKTRYVNDKLITDHYAIIPTGQGIGAVASLSPMTHKIFELIVRRFLSIFYPPAVYQKISLTIKIKTEFFFASFRILISEGYLKVAGNEKERNEGDVGKELMEALQTLKKGAILPIEEFLIKEGETVPPKRYNSGTLILAMENAGQLIEDEDLRAQIKGSGIGTSATRAEILNKLVKITYLSLNKKTQTVTPQLLGELVFEVVNTSIKSMLNAELTASWEKGLTYVADGTISEEEYMDKLEGFVTRMTDKVKSLNNQIYLQQNFRAAAEHYNLKDKG